MNAFFFLCGGTVLPYEHVMLEMGYFWRDFGARELYCKLIKTLQNHATLLLAHHRCVLPCSMQS